MKFDFSILRKSVQSLSAQVGELRSEIQRLLRERENIATAPATREDVKEMVRSWAQNRRDEYTKRMANTLAIFVRKAATLEDATMVRQRMTIFGVISDRTPSGIDLAGPGLNDMAICALFGDTLVESMSALIDRMDWPEGARPLAGRAERLQQIDAELARLTSEEQEVVRHARAAGVFLE